MLRSPSRESQTKAIKDLPGGVAALLGFRRLQRNQKVKRSCPGRILLVVEDPVAGEMLVARSRHHSLEIRYGKSQRREKMIGIVGRTGEESQLQQLQNEGPIEYPLYKISLLTQKPLPPRLRSNRLSTKNTFQKSTGTRLPSLAIPPTLSITILFPLRYQKCLSKTARRLEAKISSRQQVCVSLIVARNSLLRLQLATGQAVQL